MATKTLAEVKRPSLSEVGASGTTYFSGQLVEAEYNRDLQGQKGRDIYDRMRRSDGQVKAILSACELPLRAATWTVEPASDSPQDIEIADFISEELFGGMDITWDSLLKHILLMLPFGFMLFEQVFEIVDNKVRWKKLAPRLPKTLYTWNFGDKGELTGITQFVWKNNTYEFPIIPIERLLIFTHEREGDNYEGTSILRAAYKSWYYKDNLYRIDGIAAERHATGVPFFKHPQDAKNDDKKRLDDIGEHLYANEKAYVRLADGYEFDIKGLTGTIRDIMPSIEHHDRMISRSILADFLNLGAGETGSWALSQDKSSFFLMALRAVSRNICDTLNAAIRQLVDYNWKVESYPTLTLQHLETREAVSYAKAITDSILAGAITPGDDVEDALRTMLYLPAKVTKEVEKLGGEGSGNWGHAGRPGEVGGSGGGGGGKSGTVWHNSLNSTEKGHVSAWQEEGEYRTIRQAEMGKGNPESIARARAFNAVLDKDGNYEGVTYRGLNNLDEDSFNSLSQSEEIEWKSSSSASKDKQVALNFAQPRGAGRSVLFKIKGKTGVDISAIPSELAGEFEVILRKGTKYQVLGRGEMENIYYMTLQEK